MSDTKSQTAGANRAATAADEFHEISYYAWRRGFAVPKAARDETALASARPAKSDRLFQF